MVNSTGNRKGRVNNGPPHAIRNEAQATSTLRMNAKRSVKNGVAVDSSRAHGDALP